MRKYLLSSILLLLVGGLCAQQQFRLTPMEHANFPKDITKEANANTMNFGYCGDLAMSFVLGVANTPMKAATKFPAATMKKYLGNQLTKVKVGFGNDTGVKNAQVFLSYTLEGTPFYTQDVTLSANKWNEITLDTPYNIEDKDLYIGYSLTTGTNAQTSQFATDNERGSGNDYLAVKQSGKYVWMNMIKDMSINYNLGIKGVLEGNSLPQYEYTFDYLMPEKGFLESDEKAKLKGTLKSFGAQTIKSMDITYQVGAAAPVTLNAKDIEINSTDRFDFTIENMNVNPANSSTIKVTMGNFNGLGSTLKNTDTLSTTVVYPGENSVPRKVLLEHFTTAKCTQCPGGHTTLKSVLGDNENVIWVAHHAGFYTDDYTITESEDYQWFYNSGGATYAPAIMFDRADLRSSGAKPQGESVVFGVSKAAVQSTLKARLETPAYATVEMEKTYDEASRKLNLTVKGKALYGNLPGAAKINIYLTEDSLIGPQSGGSNKYQHDHVMRAVLTDTWGSNVTFDAEGNYTATYSYTLDSKWKSWKMRAVAFLSNYDAKGPLNCEVYNAQAIAVAPNGAPSSINSSTADNSVMVYSNDSQIMIDGEFTGATIFDMAGKVVEVLGADQASSKIAGGVYIVKITNNEQTIVKRVAVK